jgi:hypothetical protein
LVAFVTSFLLLIVGTALVFVVGHRRPPGKPITWAEGIVGALWCFGLMLLAYGVVPNQWLLMEQNQWGWRKDSFGIPTPFGTFFEKGITFFGRGRILISKEAIGDAVVTVMYIAFLAINVYLWSVWQKRGQKPTTPELETSTFGRPLVKKA